MHSSTLRPQFGNMSIASKSVLFGQSEPKTEPKPPSDKTVEALQDMSLTLRGTRRDVGQIRSNSYWIASAVMLLASVGAFFIRGNVAGIEKSAASIQATASSMERDLAIRNQLEACNLASDPAREKQFWPNGAAPSALLDGCAELIKNIAPKK